MEAIILAGGLGTRLRSMVEDVPKSMALIRNRPFLEYQLDQLIAKGVSRFILSIGYKSKIIMEHFSNYYNGAEIVYAIEETLLGTGGAIKKAMDLVTEDNVLVANGDSLFNVNIKDQLELHLNSEADITLALKPLKDFDRYGTIEMDEAGRITQFNEKQKVKEGIINGGLYIFKVKSFEGLELPEKFSIEKDVFEQYNQIIHMQGYISGGYFLDIGIPEDFKRGQYEISVFPRISENWNLILTIEAQEYFESNEALNYLSSLFGKTWILLKSSDKDFKKPAFVGNTKLVMFSENDFITQFDHFIKELLQSDSSIIKENTIIVSRKEYEFEGKEDFISVNLSNEKMGANHYSIGSINHFKDLLQSIF